MVVPVPVRRIAAACVLGVVLLLVVLRHVGTAAPTAAPLRVAPVRPHARAAPDGVVVDVEGAVRRAGLVRLPQGSRVAAAVARAGGFARRAERSGVNLAAPVSDGEQVLVPARGAPAGAGGSAGGGAAGPVSLSAATLDQLDALPGIGPVTAQKIVDYRTQHGAFRDVAELDAIPGIGPARIAELQGLVTP